MTRLLLRRLLATMLIGAALAAPARFGPSPFGLALAAIAMPPSPVQQDFATAQDGVDALVAALQPHNPAGIAALLGAPSARLLASGDAIADEKARKNFLASYADRHSLAIAGDGRAVLTVGGNDWPLPIPLVQVNGRWHFDAQAGVQEIVDRRIGRNEIGAIRTALAFVDAQAEYRLRTGVYAQRLLSRPGTKDGLYWPAAAGEPESPLGALVDQAIDEGYPGEVEAGRQVPYHGYYLRVLKGQGDFAAGGKKSYLTDGKMTGGFALLGWPAAYGSSGIMTFLVNQDGVVFQKDLGPDTAKKAAAIALFDPDLNWTRIDITP